MDSSAPEKRVPSYKFVAHSCLAENTDIKLNSAGVNKQWESHVQGMYYAMIINKIKKHRTKGPMPVKDILKEVKKKEKADAQCCKGHGRVWNRSRQEKQKTPMSPINPFPEYGIPAPQ